MTVAVERSRKQRDYGQRCPLIVEIGVEHKIFACAVIDAGFCNVGNKRLPIRNAVDDVRVFLRSLCACSVNGDDDSVRFDGSITVAEFYARRVIGVPVSRSRLVCIQTGGGILDDRSARIRGSRSVSTPPSTESVI